MAFCLRCIAMFALILVPAPRAYAEPAEPSSRYVREISGAATAIVFVHGVLGDGKSTWTNAAAYWPDMMKDDPAFDGASIYVYSYPTRLWANLSIDELAENMRLRLGADGVASYKRVIFLSHSMGGLVTRAYLLKNRDMATRTSFAYFYSTPTAGAQIAAIASLISSNPQFSKMKPMNAEDYLGDLLRQWLSAEFKFPSYCAYEKQNTYGLAVVTFQSASALCTRALDPIDADHITIVKPADRRSLSYEAFKAAYRREMAAFFSGDKLLRFEVQDIKQVKETIGISPTMDGRRVYCDSVRLTLLLAHNQQGTTPIRVNSLAVTAAPLELANTSQLQRCVIDPLSARPYGIVESNAFLIALTDQGLTAKYLKSARDISEVSTTNLLRSSDVARAVTLKPGEEPVGFDVLVQSKAKPPMAVVFSVHYDENGARVLSTAPLIIWR
jgi:pimeloyl-ACP methyl ester carboxylesterase